MEMNGSGWRFALYMEAGVSSMPRLDHFDPATMDRSHGKSRSARRQSGFLMETQSHKKEVSLVG